MQKGDSVKTAWMSILSSCLLTIVSFGGVIARAADQPKPAQHYWVRVPATNLSCEDEARAMGERFQLGARVAVESAVCRGTVQGKFGKETGSLYSILITYRADYALTPYTAALEPPTLSPMYTDAAYATYADCVADIAAQSAAFTANTKLTAVSARCDVTRSAMEGFAMMIDGFPERNDSGYGFPAASLYVFKLQFSGELDGEILPTSRGILEGAGGTVVRTAGTTFYYYSATPVSLRMMTFGYFESMEQCETQVSAAQEVYTNSGAKRVYLRCLKDLSGASLSGLADGTDYVSRNYAQSGVYFSMEECMGDRPRMLDEMRRRYSTIYGAICHPTLTGNDGRYDMDLYTRY